MDCDEFDALYAKARGCCEICGTPEARTRQRRLFVDHFHGHEGRGAFIRGLLCHHCNSVIMACFDGMRFWSTANRKWEQKAREYEANSWQKPSPEALALMAARKERTPKERPRRMRDRSRVNAIAIPSRQGVPAMAKALREWLTPGELAELRALLSGGGADVP